MAGWKVKVNAAGWMLKADPYGFAVMRVDAYAASLAKQDDDCGCDHGDEALDVEPDFYRVQRDALWSMLEDAAIEAHNGCTPVQAADTIFANLALAATEANADDDT